MTSSRRQPQNIKVEYFSNHLLYQTQGLNLSLYDWTIFYKSLKWRWSTNKDNVKILKEEILSNNLLDLNNF